MAKKISFVECSRKTDSPYSIEKPGPPIVAVNHSLIAWVNATGGPAPIGAGTTVFSVSCSDTVAADIQGDPECLVHTDDNTFLGFVDGNESHWQNQLLEWLYGQQS